MTGAIPAAQVAAWQERYGCELTEDEVRLLTLTAPTPLQGQRRHVLITYMQPMQCPACHAEVPPRAALGHPIRHGTPVSADAFTCTNCHRGLDLIVPVLGTDHWWLTEPIGPEEGR